MKSTNINTAAETHLTEHASTTRNFHTVITRISSTTLIEDMAKESIIQFAWMLLSDRTWPGFTISLTTRSGIPMSLKRSSSQRSKLALSQGILSPSKMMINLFSNLRMYSRKIRDRLLLSSSSSMETQSLLSQAVRGYWRRKLMMEIVSRLLKRATILRSQLGIRQSR